MEEEKKNTKNFLNKIFSFRERFGRVDYIIYGNAIPMLIMGIGFFGMSFSIDTMYGTLGLVLFLLSLIIGIYISIVSVIKRARDRKENIILLIILMFIPYLNVIISVYLATFKSKYEKGMINTEKSTIILERIILGLYISLLILSLFFIIIG